MNIVEEINKKTGRSDSNIQEALANWNPSECECDHSKSYIEEPEVDGTAGQVLMTDGNGGRSWGTASGGDSPFEKIVFQIVEGSPTCNKTFEEIAGYIEDGKICIGVFEPPAGNAVKYYGLITSIDEHLVLFVVRNSTTYFEISVSYLNAVIINQYSYVKESRN